MKYVKTFPTNKAEEIEMLNELNQMPVDRYLSELFTPALVTDLSEKIKNDFPCNLYEELQGEKEELRKQHQDLDDANNNLESARNIRKEYEKTIDGIDLELNEAKRMIASKDAIIEQNNNEHAMELAQAQAQVTRLKAQIYDLEHPQ